MNQIQIQESLQRFVGVFMDRILQAAEPLMSETTPPKVRTAAMRQVLLYSSSSIDIATGRFPELNILDMLVFVDLSGGVARDYWVPDVYGEEGRPLLAAFARCKEDLDLVAEEVLQPGQVTKVHGLVEEWRRKNPTQRRVEQLRPFAFAATVGRLETGSEREASGIIDSVRAATVSADQAVLMAERAMFLSQRMPFLVRFHARLALQELIRDGLATLGSEHVLDEVKDLRPIINDASNLAAAASQAAKDSQALLEVVRPLLERGEGEELRAEKLVASANRLVGESHDELRELASLDRTVSSAEGLLDRANVLLHDVQGQGLSGLGYLAVLGAFLVSLFWGGYVVAHRLTRYRHVAPRLRPPMPSSRGTRGV